MLKVYTLLGILVCTPVAMLAAVQESSYNPEAVRELVLGYDQFVKGNYTEAMERIGLAVTYDESSVFLKVLYAEVLFRAGRHSDVIEMLEPIVARGDSIDTQVYKMLAVCYQATGDTKEAIRHYKQVLKQEPDEKWIRRRLLELLSQESRYQEMIPFYKPLLDPEDPDYPVDLYQLGTIYLRIGGREPAREYLEKAVEVDSTLADAHQLLGNLSEIQGRWNEALEHYLTFIELQPNKAEQILNRVLAVALHSAYPGYSGWKSADSVFAGEDSSTWRGFLTKLEDKMAEGDSLNPVFSRVMAIGYEALGNPEKSISLYQEILRNQPADKMSRRGLLRVLNSQGRYQEMIPVYELLLDAEDNNYPHDLFQMGNLYLRTGEREKAREYLEKCVAADSSLAEGYLLLGNIHQQENRWRQSLVDYLNYLELNPEALTRLFDRLLLVSIRAEDFEASIALLESVLADQDTSDLAREQLGTLYYHADRFEEALRLLEPLKQQKTLSDNGHYTLGFLYSRLERLDDAVEAFNKVKAAQPDFLPVYLVLGRLYFNQKELDRAEGVFKEGLGLVPEDDKENRREFTFALANVYHEQGHNSKTESYLKQVLEDNPDYAPALNYLGYFYAERGMKLEEARRLINRALEKDPKNGHYIDSLGWVLFKMGHTEEALGHIKASLKALGDHSEVYEHLGDIYHAMGQPEQAREAWSKSLELDNDNLELKEKLKRLEAGRSTTRSDR